MRWSLAQMFYLVTAVAIVLGVYSQQWRLGNYRHVASNALAAGMYLALLSTSTILGFSSLSTNWRGFCRSFSLFGWCYFIFVLVLQVNVTGTYDYNTFSFLILAGIAFQVACGLTVLAFTGPVQTKKDADDKMPKTES